MEDPWAPYQTRDTHSCIDHFLLLARKTKELLPLFNDIGSRTLDPEFWIQFLPVFAGTQHFTLPFSFLYVYPSFLQVFFFFLNSHFQIGPNIPLFKTATTTSKSHKTSYLLLHVSSPLFSQSSHKNYFYLCLWFSQFSLPPTMIWILLPSFHVNNFC